MVRFCELRRNLGAPLDVRKSRVPFGLGVLTGLLVVGLFLASVLTTSRLSNGVSHSYQRALAATNLELAVTRASALENTAITSHTRGTINDFAAALKRAEGAEANLDAFERTPVGVARYLTLEHRIVALLNSGNYPQAEHLDHATENSATARMALTLHRSGQTAMQQALREDTTYKRLSQWAHFLFLLALVLLMGGVWFVTYRRASDRRRMSEASERKMSALLEHGGDAILMVDLDGVITFANGACQRVLGTESREFSVARFHELAHALTAPRLVEVLESARNRPGELVTETISIGVNEVTIVEVNVCDYSDQAAIGEAIVNIRDITERLLTQAALQREESFSTDLMERSPLFIYVKDLDLRFQRVNRNAAQLLGRNVEEIIGRTATELFASDESSILEAGERQAIADGECVAEQTLVVNGVSTLVLATYFVLRDAVGEPYAVAAVAMDITNVEKLRASERELLVGFAQSSDAMVTSYQGLITSWNPAAEDIFGYAATDVIGREVSVLLAPSHRDRLPAVVDTVYAGKAVTVTRLTGQRKDGSTFEGSLAAAPIVDSSGIVLGVSSIIHDCTAEIALASRLRTDALTGLPNREVLIEHMRTESTTDAQALNEGATSIYVAEFRVDRFNQLNSVYGGSVASALVRTVAERLASLTSLGAFVARTGRGEFAITYSATSREDAERFVEDAYRYVTVPIEADGLVLALSMSVGVSKLTSADVNAVMSDVAFLSRRIRTTSSHPIAFFDDALRQQMVNDFNLLEELRGALIERRLVPFYQPIVELATDEIVGFEALARWPHDTRGLVAPDEFITLAEDNGLIVDLGQQMRLRACRQLVEWQRATNRPSLEMHVNVSVHELNYSDFVTSTILMIEESRVDPRTIIFEITESSLANNAEIMAVLRGVNALGIRWSVDDFGTGYSSLSYLRHFPINSMKIDRSFVIESETSKGAAMVKSIIDLARVLELSTIAEGIESIEQRDLVIALGGERGQGYLWSRPVTAGDAFELLKSESEGAW